MAAEPTIDDVRESLVKRYRGTRWFWAVGQLESKLGRKVWVVMRTMHDKPLDSESVWGLAYRAPSLSALLKEVEGEGKDQC